MGTILGDKPTDTFDRTAVLGAARPVRRTRRLGYVAGGVVAAVAVAAVFVTLVLPARAPAPARPATLPPMSSSVGMGDVVSYPSSPPARPAHLERQDPSATAQQPFVPTSLERAGRERPQPVQPAYVNWPETRTQLAVAAPGSDATAQQPTLRATSNSSYPELAGLPSMPAGMGYWDAARPNDPVDFLTSAAAAPRSAMGATTDPTAEDGVGLYEHGTPTVVPVQPTTGQPLETFRYSGQPTADWSSPYGPTGSITGY